MIQHIRVAQPVQYAEHDVVQCNACGLQDPGRLAALQGIQHLMPPLGWFTGFISNANGQGGIDADERLDFCPDCYPTIQAAEHQAAKKILAGKVAVAAAVHGVS